MPKNNLTKEDYTPRDLVLEAFREGHDYRVYNYDKRWDKYHAQYRSVLEDKSLYPYMSRLFIPYSFFSVETIIPRMVSAVFESDPVVSVLPQMLEDIQRAKIVETVINWQLKRMDLFNTFVEMAKNACIYGTAIAKVDWEQRYQRKKRLKKVTITNLDGTQDTSIEQDKDGKPVLETYELQTYNAPMVTPISPYDFVIEKRAKNIDDSKYCIMISKPTYKYLEDMEKAGVYKNVKKLKTIAAKQISKDNKNIYKDVDISNPDSFDIPLNTRFTLYEYWEDDRVIVLAEEEVVLRDESNPYWHCKKPFVDARLCIDPGFYWGIGLMEMIECLQSELNDVRNQRLDNIKLAMNCMWAVERGAQVDLEDLYSEPGAVFLTNYIDGIKPLETKDVTGSAFADAKQIEEDIMNTLGTYDYARGKESSDRETATGILSLQEVASMRFKFMTIVMCKNFIGCAIERIAALNEQYLTDEVVVRLTNGKIEQYQPEDVIGRYDYEVVGASIEGFSKYARAEQLLRYRQVFISNPEFNISELDKDLLTNLNFKDIDKYFKILQPVMPQGQGTDEIGSALAQSGQNMPNVQPGQFPMAAVPEQGNFPQQYPLIMGAGGSNM